MDVKMWRPIFLNCVLKTIFTSIPLTIFGSAAPTCYQGLETEDITSGASSQHPVLQMEYVMKGEVP